METDPPNQSNRSTWIRFQRTLRRLVGIACLLPVFIVSLYLSYLLRFEKLLETKYLLQFFTLVGYVAIIKLIVFGWFQIYRGWGRFVTFYDLIAIVRAATGSMFLIVLFDRLVGMEPAVPRSIFLLDWGVTITILGGFRALVRIVQERNWTPFISADKVPAFIVGADEAGESLLRAIHRNNALNYRVIGFVDEMQNLLGTHIGGVPVIGSLDQTCHLAERHGVDEVLIAAGSLSGRQVRNLIDQARTHDFRVKVLPSYEQLISGSVAVRPRSVSINDLLRREPVRLDMSNLREWIDDRTLMITGSAGSIGSEICRQLLNFSPKRMVLVDRSENGQFFLERELRALAPNVEVQIAIADLLDRTRMRNLLERYHPAVIFHAAAYKHVPLMEAHPGEAVKNIVTATRRLADQAMSCHVESFVMISTDKAVNPTSVMGACKRAAELYVQSLAELSNTRFITVRFGNVLDSDGSVVRVFRQQIAKGGPVTVTDERMQRYFMTIPEASRLVIQAGTIGGTGEILLLDMGKSVRIVDLAKDMIRLSGLKVGEDIEIQFIGTRPGEKHFEELHIDGERHLPTRHPKIVIADRNRHDPAAILQSIEQLQQLADADPEVILHHLHQIVPEYQTEHRRSAA